jgi:uncharacterized protein YciI
MTIIAAVIVSILTLASQEPATQMTTYQMVFLKKGFSLPAEGHQLEALIFGFLMRGPNASQAGATAAEIQKGHLAYMTKLHGEGKLVAAGPFMDDSPMRGIVVYRVGTIDEAKALAAEDPAVKAGRLVLDAHPWMTFKGILK